MGNLAEIFFQATSSELASFIKSCGIAKSIPSSSHEESESSSVVVFAEEPELGQGKATGCREEGTNMAGLLSSLDPRLQISLSLLPPSFMAAVSGSSASRTAFVLPSPTFISVFPLSHRHLWSFEDSSCDSEPNH